MPLTVDEKVRIESTARLIFSNIEAQLQYNAVLETILFALNADDNTFQEKTKDLNGNFTSLLKEIRAIDNTGKETSAIFREALWQIACDHVGKNCRKYGYAEYVVDELLDGFKDYILGVYSTVNTVANTAVTLSKSSPDELLDGIKSKANDVYNAACNPRDTLNALNPKDTIKNIANFAYQHPIRFGTNIATGFLVSFGVNAIASSTIIRGVNASNNTNSAFFGRKVNNPVNPGESQSGFFNSKNFSNISTTQAFIIAVQGYVNLTTLKEKSELHHKFIHKPY
jgi:hypothetical protein